MNKICVTLVGAATVAVGAGLTAHTYTLAAPARAAKTAIIKTIAAKGLYAFQPKTKTVKVGTKVVWQNPSDAPHTVTFDKNKAHIKYDMTLNQKKSISFTFTKPGTYTYYCTLHPYMHGKIVVTK
jgi:plastocyanin